MTARTLAAEFVEVLALWSADALHRASGLPRTWITEMIAGETVVYGNEVEARLARLAAAVGFAGPLFA
jgi:hypothetical protein